MPEDNAGLSASVIRKRCCLTLLASKASVVDVKVTVLVFKAAEHS
jgi:hypothetical protein